MLTVVNGAEAAHWVQVFMGFSLLAFILAKLFAKVTKLHVILALLGVLLNLGASVFLVLTVHYVGIPITSEYPQWIVTLHRILASLVAATMLFMLFTGIFKKRVYHIMLHPWFLVSYAFIYFSGWLLFID